MNDEDRQQSSWSLPEISKVTFITREVKRETTLNRNEGESSRRSRPASVVTEGVEISSGPIYDPQTGTTLRIHYRRQQTVIDLPIQAEVHGFRRNNGGHRSSNSSVPNPPNLRNSQGAGIGNWKAQPSFQDKRSHEEQERQNAVPVQVSTEAQGAPNSERRTFWKWTGTGKKSDDGTDPVSESEDEEENCDCNHATLNLCFGLCFRFCM